MGTQIPVILNGKNYDRVLRTKLAKYFFSAKYDQIQNNQSERAM